MTAPPTALRCKVLRTPKEHQTRSLVAVVANPRDHLRQIERKQFAFKIFGDLVQIRQDDREGLCDAIKLDHEAAFGRHEIFQGIGRGHEFFVGERHEAPVLAPGVVENINDQFRFGLDVFEVDRADFQPIAPFRPGDDAGPLVLILLGDRIAIGDQVAGFRIAVAFEHRRQIGGVPGMKIIGTAV